MSSQKSANEAERIIMEFYSIVLLIFGCGFLRFTFVDSTILYAPQYIEAELKTTLTLNISWSGVETTLTVAQVIGALDTEVLTVNGTHVQFLNHWATKGVAEIMNKSDNIYHMTLTLNSIVLEDEGQYDIQTEMKGQTETVFFVLQTYALPIYLRLSSDATDYADLAIAAFTCFGNVGRPLGTLRLLRSSGPPNTDYFLVQEAISDKDLVEILDPSVLLPNGTYYVSYTFYRSMTRQDNGTTFICDIVRDIPASSATESNQETVYVDFVGVTMDINPSSIILGDQRPNSQPVETLFRCGNPAGTNIKTLLGLKMLRLTKREINGERQLLAQIREGGGVQTPESLTDIRNRATAEGAIDKQNYNTAFVSLKFNTNRIMCQDAGYYYCELDYEDGDLREFHENNTMSFSTSALPSDVSLSAPGWNNQATMKVHQAIDLRCEGKIGNDPNTKVKWKRTSPSTGLLSAYTPESYPNAVEDQGQVTELPNECSNRRVATLNYNITVSDQNSRFEYLQFQCYIEANGFEVNSTVFSIKIEGSRSEPPDTGETSEPASNAGMIAGVAIAAVVFIVIVVLLIYFLWYRRRGGGDTYKTREETDGSNPNLAPSAADLYATPNKERNRHRSDNSDQQGPPVPKPRGKKGKELHYAELDIATNVPMVAPRKSHEQVEYAEVKFNNNHDYEHPV